MIKLNRAAFLIEQKTVVFKEEVEKLAALGYDNLNAEDAKKNTISYAILNSHNQGDAESLRIKFDAIASHDITYVGIIQTARASGLKEFPLPYLLTNCHNSLCAVGGTINEDDHRFGLSAAVKYGGIYVPAHLAVIHQYARELMAKSGSMLLGSDSHTRYGALGTMAIGEGGPELVKQLLGKTYDIKRPEIVAVVLNGAPSYGVGPQDVALSIISAVFENGFVKNKILEFVGDGISNLSVEYRNGIDVMTTETTCLSSIWATDQLVKEYYTAHSRVQDFALLNTSRPCYYDGIIEVDLATIKPSIALPFHPSNVYEIETLQQNLQDILHIVEENCKKQFDDKDLNFNLISKIKNGRLQVDQAVIAGCAGGTFENICDAADILHNKNTGNTDFNLSVYPSSAPTALELVRNGVTAKLMNCGAVVRTAFCGPCFGAGDVPADGAFSIRHTTRNFPNREGSKPGNGQIASVALMDARSIAATAANGGILTAADEIDVTYTKPKYYFDSTIYKNRVYYGYNNPQTEKSLKFGPGICDWPEIAPLSQHLLINIAAYITDPVTTTDELIPSGEASSYRSNPMALAEFTLSRKDKNYVAWAKKIHNLEKQRKEKAIINEPALTEIYSKLKNEFNISSDEVSIGSSIYAIKPGDGSAREQAASCQRVLGASANIANEYATKRYRSNLINWGMLPFIIKASPAFEKYDWIFIKDISKAVEQSINEVNAYCYKNGEFIEFSLHLDSLTNDERKILLSGCLINFYNQ